MLSTYDVENSMEQISLKSFPGIRFFVESDFPLTLNSLRTNQPKNNDIRTWLAYLNWSAIFVEEYS